MKDIFFIGFAQIQVKNKLECHLRKWYWVAMQAMSWLSVVMTYVLLVVSSEVRILTSSSACPDWPFCDWSSLIPEGHSSILWTQRTLIFIVSILIAALLLRPYLPQSKVSPSIRKSTRALLGIIGFHLLTGMGLVIWGPISFLSSLYFLSEIALLSGLIHLSAVWTWQDPVAKDTSGKVQRLSFAGVMALGVQFFLGAWVKRSHSGIACSHFPNCLDQFLPIPFTFETLLAFTHRWWGFLTFGLFVHLMIAARKFTPSLARLARSTFALVIAQIALGIGTVMSRLSPDTRALHSSIGLLLWCNVFFLAVRSGNFAWLRGEKKKRSPLS